MKREVVIILAIASVFLSFCSRFSTADLPDKGVGVLSPKANEVIQKGTPYTIQWKTEAKDPEFGEVVTVELTTDGGKKWKELEVNLPKESQYVWKVPNADSAQCRVRVFSQRRPEFRGTSGVFSIK